METAFVNLGIVIVAATALGIAARMVKQPPILAYILAGILVGPAAFSFVNDPEAFGTFSTIGIAFLLFIIGLNLDFRMLKEVGPISVAIGVANIALCTLFAFILTKVLGFATLESFYISLGLAFSSTVIIVKLLADKNQLDTLHGRISIGFLLTEDFVALIALIFLSGFENSQSIGLILASTVLKSALLFGGVFLVSKYALPKLFDNASSSAELLFLSGISWCFLISALSSYIGLSLEIGAFVAGVSLAHLPYRHDLIGKVRPLRDFFIVLFFVILGAKTSLTSAHQIVLPVLLLTTFVLLVEPVIMLAVMGFFGYKKRTSFLTSINVTQVSEFSLILIAMGLRLGHVSTTAADVITWTTLLAIPVSTYLILQGESVFHAIGSYLGIFERKTTQEVTLEESRFTGHAILVGYNRLGYELLEMLKKTHKNVIVVDHDPTVLQQLKSQNVPAVFGDINDLDFLEDLNVKDASIFISTDHNLQDNAFLIRTVKSINKKIPVCVTSTQVNEALELYKLGADYVIMPHILGGKEASRILGRFVSDSSSLRVQKKQHFRDLQERRSVKLLSTVSPQEATYLNDLRQKVLVGAK